MSKLHEIVEIRYKKGLGTVGLEIETETKNTYEVPPMKYWTAHSDGSLRNFGVEFVLSRPLDPGSKEYAEALLEFDNFAKTKKFLDSTYTSVHVHFNFVDRQARHLANFITLYLLFENVLTRYCGPDRDGNLFCLKTQNSEASYMLYRDLLKAISEGRAHNFIRNLSANRYKYSALNVVPLNNLGSVEVRTHPGTSQSSVINRWVNILMCLYNLAQKYNNPMEIMKKTIGLNDYGNLVREVFGSYTNFFDADKWDEDIRENLIYAKTLAYSVDNWDTFGEPVHTVERFSDDYFYIDELAPMAAQDAELGRVLERIRTRPAAPLRRGRATTPTFQLNRDE